MKIALLALASLAALTSTAFAGQAQYGNGVYAPEKGVICDGMGKWCADGTGLSASLTEQFFGGDAASKLSGAAQDVFGFSNHVKCEIATRSCSGGSGKAARKMTKTLFGRS